MYRKKDILSAGQKTAQLVVFFSQVKKNIFFALSTVRIFLYIKLRRTLKRDQYKFGYKLKTMCMYTRLHCFCCNRRLQQEVCVYKCSDPAGCTGTFIDLCHFFKCSYCYEMCKFRACTDIILPDRVFYWNRK